MARKLGQIIAVRENTWMIRIPVTARFTVRCVRPRSSSGGRSTNSVPILNVMPQRSG